MAEERRITVLARQGRGRVMHDSVLQVIFDDALIGRGFTVNYRYLDVDLGDNDLRPAGSSLAAVTDDQRYGLGVAARLNERRDNDFVKKSEQKNKQYDQTHAQSEQQGLQMVFSLELAAAADLVADGSPDFVAAAG